MNKQQSKKLLSKRQRLECWKRDVTQQIFKGLISSSKPNHNPTFDGQHGYSWTLKIVLTPIRVPSTSTNVVLMGKGLQQVRAISKKHRTAMDAMETYIVHGRKVVIVRRVLESGVTNGLEVSFTREDLQSPTPAYLCA